VILIDQSQERPLVSASRGDVVGSMNVGCTCVHGD